MTAPTFQGRDASLENDDTTFPVICQWIVVVLQSNRVLESMTFFHNDRA